MMGIGEPLDNYDNVIRFLRLVGDENGLNIGYRHISLSTCGLVDKIDRLAKEAFPITLSISLHASNDETRGSIMPVNKKWNIDALLDACLRYYTTTKRKNTEFSNSLGSYPWDHYMYTAILITSSI
jgi:23S rRNA (adenine2503-C2)-methyltransferase